MATLPVMRIEYNICLKYGLSQYYGQYTTLYISDYGFGACITVTPQSRSVKTTIIQACTGSVLV